MRQWRPDVTVGKTARVMLRCKHAAEAFLVVQSHRGPSVQRERWGTSIHACLEPTLLPLARQTAAWPRLLA
jgi:hypothetical protein